MTFQWHRGLLRLLLAFGAVAATQVWGSVSFERVTWGTGGTTLGWAVPPPADDSIALTSPGTGGSGDNLGYLALDFPATNTTAQQTDRMANNGNGYTGNYRSNNVGAVRFDLKGYASSTLQLYFMSSADGGSTWLWNLDAPAVDQEWQTYRVNFQQEGPSGWQTSGGADFLKALSQVESIGLIVQHLGTDAPMQYGLDNWQFQLAVPEPEAIPMGAVVALTALAWGRRLLRAQRA